MKSSLQSKIAIAMWILAAASILAAATLSGTLMVRIHRESIRQQLQATATSLMSLEISNFSELNDFDQFNDFIEDTLQMERVDKIIRIFDQNGKLIFTTVGFDYDRLPPQIEKKEKAEFTTLLGEHHQYESLIIPYFGKKKKPLFLQIAIPLPHYAGLLKTFWSESLILILLLIAFSLLLSRALAVKLLKPVQAIANHLKKMDPRHIETWQLLEGTGQGEYLFEITQGINLLLVKTQTAVAHLKKMSRYVAHELRTPLTILQGEAETVLVKETGEEKEYRRILKSSLEEIHKMSDIINAILQVGDDRKMAMYSAVPFDIGQWLETNQRNWEKIFGRSLSLEIEQGPKVSLGVDPKLFYQLLDNLVRNISQHTPPQTKGLLRVQRRKDKTILSVEDDGPGLPPTVLASLNTHKSASEKAGVGLHFCFRIAEMGGMELAFSQSALRGLKAELTLTEEDRDGHSPTLK